MATTLTVSEIVLDVLRAFKTRMPALKRMSKDFRTEHLKLNQTYIAKIAGMPSVAAYDADQGGYRNGATDARTLLTDVPVVVDNHKHASLSFAHLDSIKDNAQLYDQLIGNCGYALAKEVTLDVLGKFNSRNISQQTIATVANSDYDVIDAIRNAMNLKETAGINRTGIVHTDVASVLGLDSRVISGDYRGDMAAMDSPYRTFRNIAGFDEIVEFPLLPGNSPAAVTLTGIEADDNIVTTATAHGLIVGDRVTFPTLTGGTGLTAATVAYHVVSVPSTTTLTVSATAGGSAVDVTVDATAGTIRRLENLTGAFFEPEAITILAGIPENFDTFAHEVLGAPKPYKDWTVTDPETGLTMVAIAEIVGGTLTGYLHFVLVWGSSVGKQAGATAAGSLTDYYGHRLVSL